MSAKPFSAPRRALILAATLTVGTAYGQRAGDLRMFSIDHPAIQYSHEPAEDTVARLDAKLAAGKAKLEYREDGLGYLRSLLENLGVNPDSQILVFSKTSFQAARISPRNPRALFFADDVMVGNVRGGDVLELAALDPKQGYVFYSLDVKKSDQPRFVRRDACLQCHQGPATLGAPGIMVGSVYPDSSGMPLSRMGNPVTDQHTPIQDRWGGWYVSGTHGGMQHKGNAVVRDSSHPGALESKGTQNLLNLAGKFDASTGFLSGMSDIVALMVLEHQTRMTNLMTRAGWEARIAENDGKMNDPATSQRLDTDIDALVSYMLFADEAALYDPVEGVSTFTKTFPQRGPRDHEGRSLRDFDLQKRMFRYPLSYMIYSAAFNALPDSVRERVYRRVYDVLNGTDQAAKFARLSENDRNNILAILRDTKSDLPAYWRGPSGH
jgi:hypothetical protein